MDQELSQLLQVRRDKLKELQDAGMDPFQITKFDRTHSSKDISEGYTEEERTVVARGEEKQVTAKISPLDGQNVTVAGRIKSKYVLLLLTIPYGNFFLSKLFRYS